MYSKTGIGLIGVAVFAVIYVGQFLGVPIAEADATAFINNIIGAVGFLFTIYGQFKRSDLIGGIIRK